MGVSAGFDRESDEGMNLKLKKRSKFKWGHLFVVVTRREVDRLLLTGGRKR